MKSCIYQKQDPVDIPQAETRTLKDVLELPWGFEIYSLLTRWNPLNFARPLPRPATGRKVLVVGLGPAGFTLAHHLMNDGHTVVAVDGLKIEPLARAALRRRRLRPAAPVRAGPRHLRRLRAARQAGDGRLRRGRRVRDHRPLEQELPEDHPAAAGAPGRVRHVRRRPVRRDADRRRRLRDGLRPHRPLHGGGPADGHPDEERAGPRRPPGVRLPDGACSSPARPRPSRWPTSRSGCRSW